MDTPFKIPTVSTTKALQFARLFLLLLFFSSNYACKKKKEASLSFTLLNTPVTDKIKSLTCFTSSDSMFFCGGNREKNGFIYRSTDKGISWTIVLESPNFSFNKLYFKNSQLGFALGDELEIFKTINGGATWEHCPVLDTVAYNFRVVLRDINFLNDSTALIVGGDDFGNGIILKSENSGKTWHTVLTESHELRSLQCLNESTAFAGGYGVLLKSTDGGISWQYQSVSDDFFTGIKITSNSTGLLCGYNGNLYKSTDAGASWNSKINGNSLLSSKRKHFTCIDCYNSETAVAMGENGYVLFSEDVGESWSYSEVPNKINLHSVLLVTSNSGWAVGDKGSLFYFENLE
ncbi:MAG: hypothetical protein IPN99_06835 [Bacteroidetes bacterium]|nr:hypothetical protein [Bacteroidota bacterium]